MRGKVTVVLDPALLKAAKRVALDRDSTLSATLAKGLLVHVSDPDGTEETAGVLTDKKAMTALLKGMEARARGRKGYYLDRRKDVYRRLA